MVSHADVRKDRIEKIQSIYLNKDDSFNEEQFIAQYMIKWGCKKSTMIEYINTVKVANGFE